MSTLSSQSSSNGLSCKEKKSMREAVSIRSHEDLVPYMTSHSHMTCVHAAAQLGCLGCLKWMVEHIGMHPNRGDSKYGATPLHYAANGGHLKVIKFLLPRIERVYMDCDGATPLHDAAIQGHFTCVQELLKSPLVHPEQVDNYGLTAAEWAEQAQEKKCAKLIGDCVLKKTSTISKGKKATPKKEKPSHGLLSFGHVDTSDSTDSPSSSPTYETYAQLEPTAECSCGNPPDVPPKLPETPRPSKHESTLRRSRSNASKIKQAKPKHPDGGDNKSCRDQPEKSFPPPPDSMLQSLIAANSPQCLSIPPPPQELSSQPIVENSCYYIHNFDMVSNTGKPVSAVSPYNHLPAQPTPIQLGNQNGMGRTSDITTPPAPQHSFSTFSVGGSRSGTQEFRYEPVQAPTTHSIEEPGYENALPVAWAQQQAENNCRVHAAQTEQMGNGQKRDSQHTYYNNPLTNGAHSGHSSAPNHTADTQHTPTAENCATTQSNNVPDWRRQLLQQKAKKQEQMQVAEISHTPDWRRVVQERKQASKGNKARNDTTTDNPEGLVPWQTELKKAGRVLGIDLPE